MGIHTHCVIFRNFLMMTYNMTNDVLSTLHEVEAFVQNCPHLETINQSDPSVKYCMEQAKFHLNTARELLEAAVSDPQKQYDDAQEFHQRLSKVLPLMVLMQLNESQPPDLVEEESLPGTPSSVLSSQAIFEPVTPSRPSEF